MACETPKVMTARLTREVTKTLKDKNPKLSHSQAAILGKEAAVEIVKKAFQLVDLDNQGNPKLTPAVKAKASTEPVPKKLPEFQVPGNVILAQGLVEKNPSFEAREQLLNIETNAGMRNDKGEMIVAPIYPKNITTVIREALASGERQTDVPITNEQKADFYYNTDGSMTNAENVNVALKELDRKNLGDSYDTTWSKELDNTLSAIVEMVGDINKAELKIKTTQLGKGLIGTYDPNTGEIVIPVDNQSSGQSIRNRFTMTNQETYLHETVHAVIDFAFEESNLKAGENTDLVNMVSEGKRLFNLARKNTTWEDMLIGIKHPTKHEVAQAKVRYEYIFNNNQGNGLHEFMAHLLTNKQFAAAMSQVEAGTVQAKDPRTKARVAADIKAGKGITTHEVEADMVDKITEFFRGLLNKILGFATARDGSITDAGTKLIFNIMKANHKAADKAAIAHVTSIPAKSAKFLEEQLAKLGKKFDKADTAVQEPVDRAIKAVMGKLDTRSSKNRFKDEYNHQKKRFFRLKGAKTQAEKNALEAAADKAATAKAEQVIADEAKDIAKQIKEAMASVTRDIKKEEERGESSIIGLNAVRGMPLFVKQLRLLYKLHKVSRGVYGTELAEAFATQYKEAADRMNFFEDSFIASVLEDYYEKDDLYNEMTDAILSLTHTVDGYRESMYEDVLAQTKEWFGKVDINNAENKHYDAAMTDTILRTDIQALNVDGKGLLGLLTNPDKLVGKVNVLKDKLTKQQVKDARSTAHSMVDGMGTISNADNIARGFGQNVVNTGDVDAQLVKDIDELITLMALDMTSDQAKRDMKDFLTGKGYDGYVNTLEKKLGSKFRAKAADKLTRAEYKEQVMSGVDRFIAYSRGMQEASRREMDEDPHNIIKGYMKETYSHDVDIEYFPVDQRREKEREGYVFIRNVKKQTISGQEYALFTIKDTAVKRANGALGIQGTRQRGKTLADIVNRDNPTLDGKERRKLFKKEMERAKAKYHAGNEQFGMFPIYNKAGAIVNFRSTMSHDEKSELLDMESRGTQNLSRSYGTSSTAKKTARHNKKILARLRKDYDENYKGNEAEYITIKPEELEALEGFGLEANMEVDAKAHNYARMWARLPKSTKLEAAKLFGEPDGYGGYKNGEIIVRKDLIMPVFGYDEFTVTDMKNAQAWSEKTKKHARLSEKIFQDIMQIAKGNIVIKTTDVLLGNIISNAKILGYIGVNPIKGTKLLLLGQKELKRYEGNKRELNRLLRDEMAGLPVSQRRKAELMREVENNTVAPLIDAGLYQSVVEDVSTKTDNNRVSNFFNDARDKYVTNETANTAIQYMFLTEKTKPYQALLKATQVSDFYFRYAQYHDAIDNKGQSKEQALREVTDNYINYEAPLNKMIRYGDRMGPFFFITYFTRIQRVIKRIAKKHPARVTADIMQQFILGDQDDILDVSIIDASIWGHYNPFRIFGNIWQAISPSGLEPFGIVD